MLCKVKALILPDVEHQRYLPHPQASQAPANFATGAAGSWAYAYAAYTEEEWKAQFGGSQETTFQGQPPLLRLSGWGWRDINSALTTMAEPSGTAGRPILGQIDKLELRNCYGHRRAFTSAELCLAPPASLMLTGRAPPSP